MTDHDALIRNPTAPRESPPIYSALAARTAEDLDDTPIESPLAPFKSVALKGEPVPVLGALGAEPSK